MYIADLHIHSRYSRATSRDCDLPHLDWWARNILKKSSLMLWLVLILIIILQVKRDFFKRKFCRL